MKILAVNSARSIWLVTTLFLNPRGQNLVPILTGLAERYQFAKLPQADSFLTRPLDMKWEGGSFVGPDGTQIAVNIAIHDDGLIAETRASTYESDLFLQDALSWVSETYGLPHYSNLAVERIYASEVFVQLDLPPSIFNEKFAKFIRRLQGGVSNNPGMPMEFAALHFGPDPQATKKIAMLRVERAAGVPFNRKEYFSIAPVATAEHLELLKAMEEAASA